ncbi:MAG: hypothetical protein DI598_14015 [Pseudopedobacter saltans]|uniref:Uncharacterized protein n=1 Tax=Pseudopedobacter saltans TaxID=151895 RepID=A0A2W5ETH9_9SPHI|nr:MAG: hypothetical protein DI598_14015 [Pseudopedobacter saltans]
MILEEEHLSQSSSSYGEQNENYHFLVFENDPYSLELSIDVDMIRMTNDENVFILESSIRYNSASHKLLSAKICVRYSVLKNNNPANSPEEYLQDCLKEMFYSQVEDLRKSLFIHQNQTPIHQKVKEALRANDFYLQQFFASKSFQELLNEYEFRIAYWNTKQPN